MDNTIYEHLLRIRDIDQKIISLQKQKAQTPQEIVDLKKKIAGMEGDYKSKELKFKEETSKKNNITSVIEAEKEKLAKSETKLPQVKNSKEYQAVMKEMDKAKKTVANLEEQEKAQALSAGEAGNVFNKVKTVMETLSKDYEKNLVAYKDRANSIEMDIKDMQEERARQLETLPEKIRKLYDILYKKLSSQAISDVNSGRCGVCNMMIPPQVVNNILKGEDLQCCSYCQRILICQSK